MNPQQTGWHPDPSGQFVSRYHDGNGWTRHVIDAGGNELVDAVTAPTPPGAAPPAPMHVAHQPSHPTPHTGTIAASDGAVAWVTFTAVFGLILVVLGIFALDWVSYDQQVGQPGLPGPSVRVRSLKTINSPIDSPLFFMIGGIVMLVATVATVSAALWRMHKLHLVAASLVLLTLAWGVATSLSEFEFGELAGGFWVTNLGLLSALASAAVAWWQRRTLTSTKW